MRRIGTHSGTFHCDEAMAIYMLKLLPEWENASVTRSRDPAVLDQCDILVDVGGVYDPGKLRFDHHQRGFAEYFPGATTTKLSSAGLVYKHFGTRVLQKLFGDAIDIPTVYARVYSDLIEAVDAVDNGVAQHEGGKRLYKSNTDLGNRVSRLNPNWNETVDDAELDARFRKAMLLTGEEFLYTASNVVKSWLPARSIVERCMATRAQVDPSGEIMLLDQFCPWTDHLFDLERPEDPPVKFVVFADTNHSWRVRAVPLKGESFANRLSLPEPWRGLRDAELDAVTGLTGCVFVHATGFIGGHHTREGALAMARLALALDDKGEKRQKTKD